MDAAEVWNEFDEYSLFLPDDSFNLFGGCNHDLNFNDFLAPASDETSNAFEPMGCAEHGTLNPVQLAPTQPNLNPKFPTMEEPKSFIQTKEAHVSVPEHTLPSSPGSVRTQGCDDRTSTIGSTTSGMEEKHERGSTSAKRKFLTAFSVKSGDELPLPTRRRYSQERRKAVALHRMIGSCLHCRLRKVAVSLLSWS